MATIKELQAEWKRERAIARKYAQKFSGGFFMYYPADKDMPRTKSQLEADIEAFKGVRMSKIYRKYKGEYRVAIQGQISKFIGYQYRKESMKVGKLELPPTMELRGLEIQTYYNELLRTNRYRTTHGLKALPFKVTKYRGTFGELILAVEKYRNPAYIDTKKEKFVKGFIKSMEKALADITDEKTGQYKKTDKEYLALVEQFEKIKDMPVSEAYPKLYKISEQHPELIPELFGSNQYLINNLSMARLFEAFGLETVHLSI